METPAYYNNPAIDAQLLAWLKEGFSSEDIVSQARHTWPQVPADYIQSTLQIIQKIQQPKDPSQGTPASHSLAFLHVVHDKRMKEVERLESRLDDEKGPLSVHTLYRGLLRDAEMQCFKIIAMERQLQLDIEKRQVSQQREQRKEELALARRLSSTLQTANPSPVMQSEEGDVEEMPASSMSSSMANAVSRKSCLLGFLLALYSLEPWLPGIPLSGIGWWKVLHALQNDPQYNRGQCLVRQVSRPGRSTLTTTWRRYRLVVLGLVTALVAGLSYLIATGATYEVDTYLLRLSRDAAPGYQPLGTPKLQSVIRDVTSLGSGVILTTLTILVGLHHFMRKEWHTGLFILLTILLGWWAMEGLKVVYQRERPTVVPHLMNEKSLSLPSGHSMMSMVVFLTLAAVYASRTTHRQLQIYYFTVAFLLALLIGYTRVYLGVHHPSDVLTGWLLGILWVQLAFLVRNAWSGVQ